MKEARAYHGDGSVVQQLLPNSLDIFETRTMQTHIGDDVVGGSRADARDGSQSSCSSDGYIGIDTIGRALGFGT